MKINNLLLLPLLLGATSCFAASDNPNNYQLPLSSQATSVYLCPLCDHLSNSLFHEQACELNQGAMPLATYPQTATYQFNLGDYDLTLNCPTCEHPFDSLHHDISCNLTQPVISANTSSLLPNQPDQPTTATPWCNICNNSTESPYHELVCIPAQQTAPLIDSTHNQQPSNALAELPEQACLRLQSQTGSTHLLQEQPAQPTAISGGKASFSCPTCGKKFSRLWSLNIHNRTHTGEKPYTCNYCAKQFADNRNFRRHLIIHSGEKPFTCSICGKGFADNNNLRAHLIIHSDEKPFTCSICGKQFRQANHLKTHIRVHTGEKPYTCTMCDHACSTNSELKIHMRTHTGEKPYTCTMCDHACSSNPNLKKHYRTHTGEKPFTCDICNKSFADPSNLKQHNNAYHLTRTALDPAAPQSSSKAKRQKPSDTTHEQNTSDDIEDIDDYTDPEIETFCGLCNAPFTPNHQCYNTDDNSDEQEEDSNED